MWIPLTGEGFSRTVYTQSYHHPWVLYFKISFLTIVVISTIMTLITESSVKLHTEGMIGMKKVWALLLCAITVISLFSGCACEHSWIAATCTSPQTCAKCGEAKGEALSHQWVEATCNNPKTCSLCAFQVGDKLEHNWIAADCANPKTCALCALSEGQPLEHVWKDATCTTAITCANCGATNGDPLGHNIESWETTVPSTCTTTGTESGICSVCGATLEQTIAITDHNPSDWETTVEPTESTKGTRIRKCLDCGAQLESEQFSMTPEEMKALYKSKCKSISYKELERTPDKYKGEYVKFTGYVVQVCSEASSSLYYSTYRVATSGKYNNVVYIYVDNYGSGSRILEDDKVTFYGVYDGLYTYTTVRGNSLSIPCIKVEYID